MNYRWVSIGSAKKLLHLMPGQCNQFPTKADEARVLCGTVKASGIELHYYTKEDESVPKCLDCIWQMENQGISASV